MSAASSLESSANDSEMEEEEEYIVEAIRGWRYNSADHCKEYKIKWKGYSENDNTWEPEEHLHCQHILEQFTASLPEDERRCFDHKDPEGLTGFQRHATFDKCIGADGPHESDDEESGKEERERFYCLIKFTDSEYAEEVSLGEFFKNEPEEALKFCEQRLIYKSKKFKNASAK